MASEICGVEHPEHGWICIALPGNSHRNHHCHLGSWENTDFVAPPPPPPRRRRGQRSGTQSINDRFPNLGVGQFAGFDLDVAQGPDGQQPPPIVGNDDPENSHEAAERFEPVRDSARGRVLAYLRDHYGEWVDAPVLTHEDVGGFGGTRRLRELREMGWPIETQPHPSIDNRWQHRLFE